MMKTMFSYLIYGITLTAIYELPNALGTECRMEEMEQCLEMFHHYEEKSFPNYGKDETELDETCGEMNVTIVCPYHFESCLEEETCDTKCKTTAQMINSVKKNSHLPGLYAQLCQGTEPLRAKYLEHASCLYQATNLHEECYNTSVDSLVHIYNNQHLLTTETKCCLYSWALGCYTEKTAEACGADAGNFVSEAFNMLRYGVAQQCVSHKKCDTPPLPDQEPGGNTDPTGSSSSGSGDTETQKPSNGSLQLPSFAQTLVMFAITLSCFFQ